MITDLNWQCTLDIGVQYVSIKQMTIQTDCCRLLYCDSTSKQS